MLFKLLRQSLSREKDKALRRHSRQQQRQQRMMIVSTPQIKHQLSGFDALAERTILETSTVSRDNRDLDALLRGPQNTWVRSTGYSNGRCWVRDGGARGKRSISEATCAKVPECRQGIAGSSRMVTPNCMEGETRSCRVQRYFTQALGDLPRTTT